MSIAARCETSVGAFTPTDRSQPGKIFNNQSDMICHIRDGCALRPVELRCAGTARKWRFWTFRTQRVRTWRIPLHSCRGLIEARQNQHLHLEECRTCVVRERLGIPDILQHHGRTLVPCHLHDFVDSRVVDGCACDEAGA